MPEAGYEHKDFLERSTESFYSRLKASMLSEGMSLEQVRDKLLVMDQSTPDRDAAVENLKFLTDPDIVDYIEKHPEGRDGYHNFLSFTQFHIAQRLAVSNPEKSIEYLQDALKSAKTVESNAGWVAYVEGTLLYMQGQVIPDDLIIATAATGNAFILQNLNKGLQKRGKPSYLEDYLSQK